MESLRTAGAMASLAKETADDVRDSNYVEVVGEAVTAFATYKSDCKPHPGCSSIVVLRPSGDEVQTGTSGLHHVRDLKANIAESLQIPRLCVELAVGGSRLLDDEKLPTDTPPSPCIVTLTISAQQAHDRLVKACISEPEVLEAVEAIRYTSCADDDIAFQALRSLCWGSEKGPTIRAAALRALADLACGGHVDAAAFIHLSLTSLRESMNNQENGAVDNFCTYAPWDWKDPRLAKHVYEAFTADQNVRVRQAAIRLVANAVTKGDDSSISFLQSRLECQKEDTLVRRMVAGALIRVAREGHSSAVDAIAVCVHDEDPVIQRTALKFKGHWQH